MQLLLLLDHCYSECGAQELSATDYSTPVLESLKAFDCLAYVNAVATDGSAPCLRARSQLLNAMPGLFVSEDPNYAANVFLADIEMLPLMKKLFDDVRLVHRETKCREKHWRHLTKTCDYATRKKRWRNV